MKNSFPVNPEKPQKLLRLAIVSNGYMRVMNQKKKDKTKKTMVKVCVTSTLV
jgi:hypothetical protein